MNHYTERQAHGGSPWLERYRAASKLALQGQFKESRSSLRSLLNDTEDSNYRALALNDLATLMAIEGRHITARQTFGRALECDSACEPASHNTLQINRLLADRDRSVAGQGTSPSGASHDTLQGGDRHRIAILSLLFNWPSTGGGTIHTYETAKFLKAAGYDVRHIFARQSSWRIGTVTEPLDVPYLVLDFDDSEWRPRVIRRRFQIALDEYSPDFVIVTDSWNTKPLLCEAASEFPYYIRIAALETICPLNNVRMLVEDDHQVVQCARNQLQDPDACRECVAQHRHLTGELHRAERALARFERPDYPERLRRAFAEAQGVLAVNPVIAELVRPFAKATHVIPSGFDPSRFPSEVTWPAPSANERKQVFFAGLTHEFMKGFHILQEAAEQLWRFRQDFEVVATSDPVGQHNEFTRFIGWQTQESLPQAISDADVVVFPTVAQEALGRSAVEAMGCGRPVVASRIGGLPWVIEDEVTGLLFEPGNAADLTEKLSRLFDDPDCRARLGRAGRLKFDHCFTWDAIIRRHYVPLFGAPVAA
jgi:glycosyltransferase involved in cell wall biosynthesis